MNKTKKIISLLSGLGEDITVRDATRVKLNNGSTRIDLTLSLLLYVTSSIIVCTKCVHRQKRRFQ